MNARPVLLSSLGDSGRRLDRIEAVISDTKDEAWLQELLFRHPELLPVDEFDESFGPLIPIGREMESGRGPMDDVFVSPTGDITIVETKLWKNPEKHRTVVAQIIDYAKELTTWDYDRLCAAVLSASRSRGETSSVSLEEKVAPYLKLGGFDLTAFQEGVSSCLAGGNFLLLIVGDRVSPNVALLTQAIQSAPGLGFTLGLVELQLYPLTAGSDWPLLVVPDVVGRTVEKTRSVVRVLYQQEKPRIAVEVETETSTGELGSDLDIDVFLSQIPTDLATAYKEAFERWRGMGGTFHITPQIIYWEIMFSDNAVHVFRCNLSSVWVIRQRDFERWSKNPQLYQQYRTALENSPTATATLQRGKVGVSHAKLSASELKVLLNANMHLVEAIKDEQV